MGEWCYEVRVVGGGKLDVMSRVELLKSDGRGCGVDKARKGSLSTIVIYYCYLGACHSITNILLVSLFN